MRTETLISAHYEMLWEDPQSNANELDLCGSNWKLLIESTTTRRCKIHQCLPCSELIEQILNLVSALIWWTDNCKQYGWHNNEISQRYYYDRQNCGRYSQTAEYQRVPFIELILTLTIHLLLISNKERNWFLQFSCNLKLCKPTHHVIPHVASAYIILWSLEN